jgi:hypothetical protein
MMGYEMELHIDRDAWLAGFRTGEAGQRGTCPHPPASNEAYSWSSGFVEGKAKRDGHEYSGPEAHHSI